MKILRLYFYLISIISVSTMMFVFEEDKSIKNLKSVFSTALHQKN